MNWLRDTLKKNRIFVLAFLLVETFYWVDGQQVVYAHEIREQEREVHLRHLSALLDVPVEKLRGEPQSLFEPLGELAGDVSSSVGVALDDLSSTLRRQTRRATSGVSRLASRLDEVLAAAPVASAEPVAYLGSPQAAEEPEISKLRPAPRAAAAVAQDAPRERTGRTSRPELKPLPLRRVERKARTEKAVGPARSAASSAVAPSLVRQVIPKENVAPEIAALAESLGDSPAEIFGFVDDEIDFDPKWGAQKSPLGTLQERQGTSWDQAWLLQQLLTAAGVDARLEWGEVEISAEMLRNITGVEDPWRAGDLLTTAGTPIVLLVEGSQVRTARMSHVWVKAHLDYFPDRGATPGPGDTWIRMDPSLKRFAIAGDLRLDEAVPYDLGEYLQSGTELSPRQFYEEALDAYVADNHPEISSLEELKRTKSVVQEGFPFVPGTLRGKILSLAGESVEVPESFQQRLKLEVREAGGPVLASYSTPWPAVHGKRLELVWPGATSADQASLDLYGGVFSTPPFEVDLKPSIRVEGVEVAAGGAVGSAEDVVVQATLTTPQGLATVVPFEMWAGEHAVLSLDFGRTPQETVDRYTQELAAATEASEQEAWSLALAGAHYQRSLGGDLDHLGDLRWQRVLNLGTAVLAVQRGAVSVSPGGTPLTFSRGPTTLDLGSMPLGLFPAEGEAVPTVSTLELLGSQGSYLEGEALAQAFAGDHVTGVTFLTRAVRDGQTLTRVDATNVEEALTAVGLSDEAEANVLAGVEQGRIAWIPESQLLVDTFDATGYVLEDPATGAAGYFVTFVRLVEGLDANIVFHSPQNLDVVTAPIDVVATIESDAVESWTLTYQMAGEGPAVVLATGEGSVTEETLAEFDPTLLLNGLYDIVLTGRDVAGQSVSEKVSVTVEGNMKLGHFTLSFVDLAISLSGLVEHRKGDGGVVTYAYDSRNRLVERTWSDDSGFVFTYTPTGRRASVTDARGTTGYVYDSLDRLTELTYPDGRRLTYDYDANGNRTRMSAHVAGQVLTTSVTWDALNQPQTVTDPEGGTYFFQQDPNGNRTSLQYPNGTRSAYTYDSLNRLTALETTQTVGGVVLQSYALTLAPSGHQLRVDEQGEVSRQYSYDPLNRLIGELVTTGGVRTYEKAFEYDPVGNRLSQTELGAEGPLSEIAYTYDSRDRLLTEDTTSYTWDADGNLRSRGTGELFDWDDGDRLRTLTLADGTVVSHTYDADGVKVRTAVTAPGGSTEVSEYLVDTSLGLPQVVAQTDGAGDLRSYYVLRDDQLLGVSGTAGTKYFNEDPLGSTRLLTDESGQMTDRYTYTAFGELIEQVGDDENPFLFAGQQQDSSSGLYYLRARWMDPRLGRFASMDTFSGSPVDPRSLHPYLYAHADPVNMTDATGLFSVGVAVVAMVVAVMAAFPVGAQTQALRQPRGRDWTEADVTGYQGFIEPFAQILQFAGDRRDCADLAIDAVITYADRDDLHVPLWVSGWRRYIDESERPNYTIYSQYARTWVGAWNLADHQNTRAITYEERQPGDLLLFNWHGTTTWHTFLYTGQGVNRLWFGNTDDNNNPTQLDFLDDRRLRNFGGRRIGPDHYFNHDDLHGDSPRRWDFFPE